MATLGRVITGPPPLSIFTDRLKLQTLEKATGRTYGIPFIFVYKKSLTFYPNP